MGVQREGGISWCDATWNPVRGCMGVVELIESQLEIPLRWKRPRRIFVNSMSDTFQEGLPDDAIDRIFAVIVLCPQHTFLVLTKRARRMMDYLAGRGPGQVVLWAKKLAVERGGNGVLGNWSWPPPNVWLGVSCED